MMQLIARSLVSGCIYFTGVYVIMDAYYYLRKRRRDST